MNRGKILTGVVVVAFVGLGLTVLMAANTNEKPSNAPAEKPAGKRVVIIGEMSTYGQKVDIYPENYPMPSRVIKVLVVEGAEVKMGQALLEFDRETFELKVQEAENGIALAKAEIPKAEAAIRIHKAEVESNEKTWKSKQKELEQKQSEFKEAERLYKLMAINQLQYEAADAAVKAAEYALDSVKIKLDSLRVEVPNYFLTLANANVKLKESLKAQAEHARDQLSCKAPADGRIIRSFASEGMNFGSPSNREPAFWFLKKGPLLVRAEVTQEFARRIVKGQAATIQDESDSSQSWSGRVTKLGDQFLPKRGGAGIFDFMPTSDERVLECQISIELNAGETGPKFGQKVRVTLE